MWRQRERGARGLGGAWAAFAAAAAGAAAGACPPPAPVAQPSAHVVSAGPTPPPWRAGLCPAALALAAALAGVACAAPGRRIALPAGGRHPYEPLDPTSLATASSSSTSSSTSSSPRRHHSSGQASDSDEPTTAESGCGRLCRSIRDAPSARHPLRAARVRVRCAWHRFRTTYLPHEYFKVASIAKEAALYYLDIALDIRAALRFAHKRQYLYLASNVLGILLAHFVASSAAEPRDAPDAPAQEQATEAAGGHLEAASLPFRLALRAAQFVRDAPVLQEGEELSDARIEASLARFSELLDLEAKVQRSTFAEMYVEAPVNTLVQLYALLHERQLDSGSVWGLVLPIVSGVVAHARGLARLDSQGFVTERAHTRDGDFAYVIGSGCTWMGFVAILAFRLVESASRLSTLALLQEALRCYAPGAVWARGAMLGSLAASAAVLLGATLATSPRHRLRVLPAVFAFPAPLAQPPAAKVGPTCAATHYAVRVAETAAAWAVIVHAVPRGSAGSGGLALPCQLAGAVARAFCAMAPLMLAYQHCAGPSKALLKALAGQLRGDAKTGALLWPAVDPPHEDPTPVLQALGLRFDRLREAQLRGSGTERAAHGAEGRSVVFPRVPDELEAMMQDGADSVDLSGRELVNRFDDMRADWSGRALRGVAKRLRKLDVSYQMELTAAGWKVLLGGLRGGVLESLDLSYCGLDEAKCSAIATALRGVAQSLRELDVSHNDALTAAGRVDLLAGLAGGALEKFTCFNRGGAFALAWNPGALDRRALGTEFSSMKHGDFGRCAHGFFSMILPLCATVESVRAPRSNLNAKVDDATANVIGPALGGVAGSLKKLGVSESHGLTVEGWKVLLGGLPGGVLEALDLSDCHLCEYRDEAKASAIAPALAGVAQTLRELNVSQNRNLSAAGWQVLLGSLSGGVLEALNLRSCDIDDAKAGAIASALGGVAQTFRDLNVSNSRQLTPTGWQVLLGSLPGGVLEALDLTSCGLDDAKAGAIAPALSGVAQTLRKLDVSMNGRLTAAGWQVLLGSLPGGVLEALDLRGCELDDAKADADIGPSEGGPGVPKVDPFDRRPQPARARVYHS